MKSTNFNLVKYEADEGYVFDWAEPRFHTELDAEENEIEVQDHLYARTLFLGVNDTIENYIEVKKPEEV